MNLLEIVKRQAPRPWVDGEKIPWHEPEFSQRMLREHLSQAHDAASRRFGMIDGHVGWIHGAVLGGKPSHILDLGCGPGLYLNRLARLGHTGTGIDFSPASIAYARETAQTEGLAVVYRLADLRTAVFWAPGGAAGEPPGVAAGDSITGQHREEVRYDLAMLIYGEFSTFRKEDARAILRKAADALRPGGKLLLEPSTVASIVALGAAPASWYAAESGLWSERPHVVLRDNAWDGEQQAAVERYVIIDAASGTLVQHAMTTQACAEEELMEMLSAAGFTNISMYSSLPCEVGGGNAHAQSADHPAGYATDQTAEEPAPFYAVLAEKAG
jgi:SAM-dependent methyltransferase